MIRKVCNAAAVRGPGELEDIAVGHQCPAETYAEWLDVLQGPELAVKIREECAEQIEFGQNYIDGLTQEEERRFENAEKERSKDP